MSQTSRSIGHDAFAEVALVAALTVVGGTGLLLYLSGGIAALVLKGHWPHADAAAVLTLAFATARHLTSPARAWPTQARSLLPSPEVFYSTFFVLLAICCALAALTWTRVVRTRRKTGFARAGELRRHLSVRALRSRAPQVRPSLRHLKRIRPENLGVSLGREVSSGKKLWASLEDSFLILGPPRSSKSSAFVIPGVIEAPGAVVVTSIRPEVLRHTARAREGPTLVFDPQNSARWPSRLRWSPVAGCEDPLVAIRRARGFAEGAGTERVSSADAAFFDDSAASVIRCYLHAAALAGRTMTDVTFWAARPQDPEPVSILERHTAAAAGWGRELQAQGKWDARTRDGIWATVKRAFDCLADPRVLETCSPSSEETFDAKSFVSSSGTLHVIGTPGAQLSVAPLISAFISDIVEQALEAAAVCPSGRIDPPLSLWFDEAANIAPLASLPQLLSAGGGSGICSVVVLQSLAQARTRWGADQADAIWDASTVRVVFGGSGLADDLVRISRLTGEVDEEVTSRTRGDGGTSWSTSPRQKPVLPPERLRTLPERHAVVLHRRTPPVEAICEPWWERPLAQKVAMSKWYTKRLCKPA